MDHRLTRREAMIAISLGATSVISTAEVRAEDVPPTARLLVKRVLFLGNSITLHGPAPQIGWTGNWGMAASAENRDYVHLLLQKLSAHCESPVDSKVRNIAEFERTLTEYKIADALEKELAFQADLVIVAIGENVAALTTDEQKSTYASEFHRLLTEIKKHGAPTIIIRSCFWPDSAKDRIMEQECTSAGGVWVDISTLGSDEKNYARSERQIDHAGVAGHPGDSGMQAIADGLWTAIRQHRPLWSL